MYEQEYEATENYKGIDDITAQELYDRWLALEELRDENVGSASLAVTKLEALIRDYGEDAANEAVFAVLGSDDASMLINDYENDLEKGYVNMQNDWYRPMIAENLAYMPRNYSAEECYDEFKDALLFEVFKFEAWRPRCKEALDAFLISFCGGTFEELFGLEQ